jgi:hypothetical protein
VVRDCDSNCGVMVMGERFVVGGGVEPRFVLDGFRMRMGLARHVAFSASKEVVKRIPGLKPCTL